MYELPQPITTLEGGNSTSLAVFGGLWLRFDFGCVKSISTVYRMIADVQKYDLVLFLVQELK